MRSNRGRPIHDDSRILAGQLRESAGEGSIGDHVARLSPDKAVPKIAGGKQSRRRNHDRSNFMAASMTSHMATTLGSITMMRSPRRTHFCAESWLPDSSAATFGRSSVSTPSHFRPRSTMPSSDCPGVAVEIIQRPVELRKLGPAELPVNEFIVGAMLQEKVARTEESIEVRIRRGWSHWASSRFRSFHYVEWGRQKPHISTAKLGKLEQLSVLLLLRVTLSVTRRKVCLRGETQVRKK